MTHASIKGPSARAGIYALAGGNWLLGIFTDSHICIMSISCCPLDLINSTCLTHMVCVARCGCSCTQSCYFLAGCSVHTFWPDAYVAQSAILGRQCAHLATHQRIIYSPNSWGLKQQRTSALCMLDRATTSTRMPGATWAATWGGQGTSEQICQNANVTYAHRVDDPGGL